MLPMFVGERSSKLSTALFIYGKIADLSVLEIAAFWSVANC